MRAEPRILVAEDDPAFRRVILFTLGRAGLQAEAAPDGQVAHERLSSEAFSFLVTDHQMPRLSGLELIDRVRNELGLVELPIILCTAKGLELDASGLRQRYGLLSVMHKPFSPRKLTEIVHHSLCASGAGTD